MSIEKYTTEGFILREFERGENDMVYKIWTKDFGIIFALARSIRKESAKLRMLTKKHDFMVFTLVKGKEIWRLTGSEDIKDLKRYGLYFSQVRKIIFEVIDRFMEEKKPYKKLYERLKSVILDTTQIDQIDIFKLKILFFYLVLVDTGYADARVIGASSIEEYKEFSLKDFFTHFILNEDDVKKHVFFVLKSSMI